MSRADIIKYYLLCTVRVGVKKHIVDDIPSEKLGAIISKRDAGVYLRKHNGYLIARESVVGGGSSNIIVVV